MENQNYGPREPFNADGQRQYNQQGPNGYGPYGPQNPNRMPNSSNDFVDAIKTCISKYVDFNGRAGRPEFWWWTLFSVLITGGFAFAPGLNYVISVAALIPSLSVTWRRLHDIGKAGGYFFIGMIPLVGWIILIVWLCQPSQSGPNRFGYGPDDIHINRPPF